MQLPQLQHRFVAEILREGPAPLTAALKLDWVPAVEWGRLQHIRYSSPARANWSGKPHIHPAWDRAAGAPYVSHVEVRFEEANASGQALPLQFFADPVAEAVSALVKMGEIKDGEKYRWRICAYPIAKEEISS